MKENKVVTISAQIPAELEKTLIELCELEERSKSYFIKKALEKLILEKTKGAIRIEALKFWLRDNAEALDEKNDAGISFLERAVHVLSPKDFRTLFPNL